MYNSGESFKKGQAFENFVETVLFPKSDYDLVEKTHDYSQNSVRFVESTKNPDFKFRCRKTHRTFWVEAKYRSQFNSDNKISVIDFNQRNRYVKIDNDECPVLLIVGYQGSPDNPKNLSLIPIKELMYPDLYDSVLKKYEITKKYSIPPDSISKYFKPAHDTKQSSPVVDKNPNVQTFWQNRNYRVVSYAALIVFAILTLYFLVKPSTHISHMITEVPGKGIEDLKLNITKYYEAIDNNNIEVLDYFLNRKLDRWYSQRNVSIDFVKKESARYFLKYPHHKTDVQWDTFQYSVLPNGDFNASYELLYEIQQEGYTNTKKFHLKIYSIWSKNLKIKSLYETKM